MSVVIQNVDGAGGRLGAIAARQVQTVWLYNGVVGLESVSFMYALGQLEDNPQEWSSLGQLSTDALLVAVNANAGWDLRTNMKKKDFRFGVTSEMLPSAAVICKLMGANFRPVLFDGSAMRSWLRIAATWTRWFFRGPLCTRGVRDSQGKIKSLFVVNKTRLAALPMLRPWKSTV